jgi:hypothetical protein
MTTYRPILITGLKSADRLILSLRIFTHMLFWVLQPQKYNLGDSLGYLLLSFIELFCGRLLVIILLIMELVQRGAATIQNTAAL